MNGEHFVERLNGYRTTTLPKPPSTSIAECVDSYGANYGTDFIERIWTEFEKMLMQECSKPQHFGLKEVRRAAGKALCALDDEGDAGNSDCEKCEGSGTLLVYGTHDRPRLGSDGRIAHGLPQFFAWKVAEHAWPPEWPVTPRLYACPCGRSPSASHGTDGLLRADGDLMTGWLRYFGRYLDHETKGGNKFRSEIKADAMAILTLLKEAGRQKSRQYQRYYAQATRLGHIQEESDEHATVS